MYNSVHLKLLAIEIAWICSGGKGVPFHSLLLLGDKRGTFIQVGIGLSCKGPVNILVELCSWLKFSVSLANEHPLICGSGGDVLGFKRTLRK